MEEKYKQFLNFDWKTSQEWKEYFNCNCYIAPPVTGEKILKARKKFYKAKIDPEFDINYTCENVPNHKHEYTGDDRDTNRKTSMLDQMVAAVEGFLWVAFFMNVLLPRYILQIGLMALALRFIRYNWRNLLSKDFYTNNFLKNDLIQLMIYSLILMTDHVNYLNLFPLTSTAFYSVCEYFCYYLRIFQFLKKYFQMVVNYQKKIEECRAFAFVLFGLYLIIALIIRWSTIFIGISYPFFMWFLYYYNDDVRVAIAKVKRYINVKLLHKSPVSASDST